MSIETNPARNTPKVSRNGNGTSQGICTGRAKTGGGPTPSGQGPQIAAIMRDQTEASRNSKVTA